MSFSFSQGQQLTIDGCRHVVGLVNEKQQCQLTSDDGELLVKTIPELVRLYSEGRLRGLRPTQALALNTHDIVDLANIPDVDGLKKEAVREAVLKHMCIKHLLEAGLWTCTPEKLSPLLEDYFLLHGEGRSFKRTVMYQAYRRYIDSGGDWRAQLPRYFQQGNRTRRYTREIYSLATEALDKVYLTSCVFWPKPASDSGFNSATNSGGKTATYYGFDPATSHTVRHELYVRTKNLSITMVSTIHGQL